MFLFPGLHKNINVSLFSFTYYRLDPNKFVESIRTLLKNNAPNEDFHAFYKLVLDNNVSFTIRSNQLSLALALTSNNDDLKKVFKNIWTYTCNTWARCKYVFILC